MAVRWCCSEALLHPRLFILCQCVHAWQTAHTPVTIVLSGSTGVHSDSCWLVAQWYYTCAAPLPALGSRFPVCVCMFLCAGKKGKKTNKRMLRCWSKSLNKEMNISVPPLPVFFSCCVGASSYCLFLWTLSCHFVRCLKQHRRRLSPPITYTTSASLT